MASSERRCKYCAVREVFYCPRRDRVVEPGNEVRDCRFFRPKDRGVPRQQKAQGSLGG